MTRRLLSLAAIPLSLLGHLILWPNSVMLLRLLQLRGDVDVLALLLVIVGIAIILTAVATLSIGSLGLGIVGCVQLLFSLGFHLLPFDFRAESFTPSFDIMNAVRGLSMEVSDGMFSYFPPGIGAIVGGIMLGAALGAARRRVPDPVDGGATRDRVVTGLAGIIGLLGIVLALAGGAGAYVRQLVTLQGAQPLDLVMLYGGVLLIGAVAYAVRWSSAGVVVAGVATAVAGLVGLAVPIVVIGAVSGWQLLGRGVEIAAPSGLLLLIGLVLLAAGGASRLRARRVS